MLKSLLQRRAFLAATLIAMALVAMWLVRPFGDMPRVEAHGKELGITVSSLIPDPDRPLVRLYRVRVVFANDLEPVQGATVLLQATREENGFDLHPMRLTQVEDAQGLYVGEVTYPRFGNWTVWLNVTAALGQGDGATAFVDKISPAVLTTDEEAALEAEAQRVYKLQLLFKFSWWPDMVNIIVRVVHSMSALAYAVMVGLLLFVAWAGATRPRPRFVDRMLRLYLPVTLAGLLGILASGLYGAAFDAPTTAPGIYDLDALLRLPYGSAYLAAFLVKPVVWVVLLALAFRVNAALTEARRPRPVGGGAAEAALGLPISRVASPAETLRKLALVNVGVGLLLIVDLAVLIYLHYLSHLGVFIPPS